MTGHEGISKIAFTGSTTVGKRIMSRASDTLKRINLELGGKGPIIICEDGDINKASELIAERVLMNSG